MLLVLLVLVMVERLMVAVDALASHRMLMVLQAAKVVTVVRVAGQVLVAAAQTVLGAVAVVRIVARVGERHANDRGQDQQLAGGVIKIVVLFFWDGTTAKYRTPGCMN